MSHNLHTNLGNWCIFPENKLIYQGKWLKPQIVSGGEIIYHIWNFNLKGNVIFTFKPFIYLVWFLEFPFLKQAVPAEWKTTRIMQKIKVSSRELSSCESQPNPKYMPTHPIPTSHRNHNLINEADAVSQSVGAFWKAIQNVDYQYLCRVLQLRSGGWQLITIEKLSPAIFKLK